MRSKWLDIADSVFDPLWFKLIMVVATLLTAVPFIHAVIGGYVKVFLLYGFVTVLYQVIRGRIFRFLRDKAGWLLVGFAAAYGVTCLTAGGNVGANISALAYMVLFFALFAMWTAESNREEVLREVRVLAWTVAVITCVFAFANFLMFAFGIGGTYTVHGEIMKYGMADNRLFGLYNANTGSTLCVISFILSGGLLLDEKRPSKWAVAFHTFNMLFQFVCLLLTGSRAALYVLYLLVAIGGFAVVLRRPDAGKKLLHFGKSAGAAVAAVLVLFGSMHGLRAVLSYVPVWTAQLRAAVEAAPGEEQVPVTVDPYDFTRLEESENRDGGFFNGRVDLWDAGLGAFKESPVLGIGRENLYDRAEPHLEDKQWAKNLSVGGLHNIYLTILTCSGAVGLLLMGAYTVWVLCRAGRCLVRDTAQCNWFAVLVLLALMFFITEFVEARILYQVNVFNVLFWVLFGYLNALARHRKPAEAEEVA